MDAVYALACSLLFLPTAILDRLLASLTPLEQNTICGTEVQFIGTVAFLFPPLVGPGTRVSSTQPRLWPCSTCFLNLPEKRVLNPQVHMNFT